MKFALRTLFKTPFVTTVAIVSLALGIGANAAIFSLFNQMLLRPLPVAQPDGLANLLAPGPKPGNNSCNQASTRGNCDDVFSYPMFRDLERAQTVFTGLAAHRLIGVNLSFNKQTINGDGLLVSGSYFPVLGLRPQLGRLLGPGDDPTVGESHVAVLSDQYWRNTLGADPKVLDSALVVNGQTLTIVGVAPRGFDGTTLGAEPKIFAPVTLRGLLESTFNNFENRRSYSFYLFGRLKPGVSLEQAHAGLEPIYRGLINDVEVTLQTGMSPQTLQRFKTKPILVEAGSRGQSGVPNQAGASLMLLLGVTAFVLVIACANIANLLLVRSVGRSAEIAVRLSIGASRLQLVRQLLLESMLLALLGGAAGLLVAQWTLDLVVSLLPAFATAGFVFTLDRSALLFAAALTVATGLLFGLFPAIHSTRPDLAVALKGQSGQPSGARGAARFRTSLATAQIALSLALLIAAGLFTRSLMNVSRVELGVKAESLLTFSVSPSLNGYKAEKSLAFFDQLEDNLRALPGVTGVTSALVPLLGGNNWGNSVSVEGFTQTPDTNNNASYNEVSPGFFRTVGMPLIAGREFLPSDAKESAKVAIVNEAFAKKFNLGRDVVGKHIGAGDNPMTQKLDIEIVGFVQDAKYSEVKREIPPQYFRPTRQGSTPQVGSLAFYVRTSGDPHQFLTAIPRVVAELDPNLPIEGLRTMDEQIRQNVFLDRMISVLSAAFAVLATLLAAVGLYGVLAYTVTQRTREIGLRMALGADASRVRAMILRQVGVMTMVGGAIGLVSAAWLGRLSQSLLYQMKGYDPLVLAGATVALVLVALAAGFIPANRASKVDPMLALRYE